MPFLSILLAVNVTVAVVVVEVHKDPPMMDSARQAKKRDRAMALASSAVRDRIGETETLTVVVLLFQPTRRHLRQLHLHCVQHQPRENLIEESAPLLPKANRESFSPLGSKSQRAGQREPRSSAAPRAVAAASPWK